MTQPDKLSVEVVKESRGELLSEGFAIDSVAIMVHDQLAATMRENEPDTLVGRIATGLILELDGQIKSRVLTEQEWETWARLCAVINWRRVALSTLQDLNANISYAAEQAKPLPNRNKESAE